jgi:hypothetical protein
MKSSLGLVYETEEETGYTCREKKYPHMFNSTLRMELGSWRKLRNCILFFASYT